MSEKTLIRGGWVLTLGARTPNYSEADVLIDDGRIAEVGPGLRSRDAELVDATNSIVMPGFVDSHRHAWKSAFRNYGRGDYPVDGVEDSVYGPKFQPDDVYASTLIGLLGAVEAGITTVVDWSDIQVDDEYTTAALQAHQDAGVRTVFVYAKPTWSPDSPGLVSGVRRLLTERPVKTMATTNIAFGSSNAGGSGLDRLSSEWEAARESSLRIHVHAGMALDDTGALVGLAGLGLLGADVTLIHCAHLNDADLDTIVSSGASVVLTPSTEMTGKLGMPPLQKLLDRRIRPGLGVDNEGEAPGDIFAQMRATNSVQHAAYFDLKLAGKAGLPNLLTTRDVIRYATLDGARAVGLGDVTGSLESGKRADVIVLRTDRPNVFPINDPIGAVVWGMDTSNLDWVFVDGKALMRNGALEGDVANVREMATTAQTRVAVASGLMAGTGLSDKP